jgi:hypothetical protein
MAMLLTGALLLAGCEDDDSWPDDYGNRETLVINNTDEAIEIEYQEEVIEVGTTFFDNHTDTIPAHRQKEITLYYNDWGSGHVTVMQDDKKKTLTVPVEHATLSVDADDLN